MNNKNLNKYADKIINAFLKNKLISPLPIKFTKKISEAQKFRKFCEKKLINQYLVLKQQEQPFLC